MTDTLSKKSIDGEDTTLVKAMETQVHTVISTAPVSTDRLEDIKTATAQDEYTAKTQNLTKNICLISGQNVSFLVKTISLH